MTSLQVSWDDDAFGFNMDFEKDECSSHMNAAKSEKGCWFMSSVMFKYNSSDESIFTNAKNAGHQVAYNNNSKMFETPQGYSSLCNKGTSLPLTGDDGTTSTTLSLSAVQLQPFGVKLGEFSKGYLCLEAMSPRNVRNQKVAIATGSVLAVVALLVIVGYYIRRTYFDRIKYQTMQ
ncbi:PREDICTED: uncharacterized protein LOC106808196 [Priapulus caudatus]|uniref:Uncharacterized protein LOC106808196 n=1 Tax=Priapulus caudatus TaxID=37621 RepID=A0ABM1E266_PRICU|nr:PREDICTED: uncharacterized protein LOC106808196 [Priapulus caudatus]